MMIMRTRFAWDLALISRRLKTSWYILVLATLIAMRAIYNSWKISNLATWMIKTFTYLWRLSHCLHKREAFICLLFHRMMIKQDLRNLISVTCFFQIVISRIGLWSTQPNNILLILSILILIDLKIKSQLYSLVLVFIQVRRLRVSLWKALWNSCWINMTCVLSCWENTLLFGSFQCWTLMAFLLVITERMFSIKTWTDTIRLPSILSSLQSSL